MAALPIGLSEGCVLRRNISKDDVLSFDDVELPAWRGGSVALAGTKGTMATRHKRFSTGFDAARALGEDLMKRFLFLGEFRVCLSPISVPGDRSRLAPGWSSTAYA